MRAQSQTYSSGQSAIHEAADRVVDSVLLKTTNEVPDQEHVREVRASVERQINDLILAVQEHVAELSNQALCPTFAPKDIAQNLGITVDKVLTWIHNGQLEAIDVSSNQQGRRRYRIDADAIARFKAARSTQPLQPVRQRRKKKRSMDGLTEFF